MATAKRRTGSSARGSWIGRGSRGVAPAAVLILVALGQAVWAMGTKEPSTQSADGKENWQHSFDISAMPAGKFNVYVEAKDLAGNKAVTGPFNIVIDPKSDLPVARILNPLPAMRVGGDLTIVGTCDDDDGVAKVEVSVDGGDWVEAEGTALWSLYLKTASIPDGRRSLSVRGTDINGLVGKETKLFFNLDRFKPVVQVATPEPGALVAGAIRLQGEARDANGLRSLEMSLDGGTKYAKLELKRGRAIEKAGFSAAIDTRKIGDGPKVIWFRCVDGVGSSSTTAYLLIIDNTKPTIRLVRPQPGQAVNGLFSVVGSVNDAVGIKRLSYEFAGSQKGEIPLRPGDPYFALDLDAGPLKSANAPVVLIAEDRIGNVTRLAIAPKIDREADKPVVLPLFPQAEGRVRAGEQIWGSVSDDDGVAAVRWSIDGGPPTQTPASEAFALGLPDLGSGRHIITMAGVDTNGLVGNPRTLPFVYDRGRGQVSFLRLSAQAQGKAGPASRDFSQGIEVKVDGGEQLEGMVSMPNPPTKAEWSIGTAAARKLELQRTDKTAKDSKGGDWGFRIPMDRSLPYGFAPISVRVSDGFGNEAMAQALVYVTNYASDREPSGFRFEEGRASEDGSVRLGPTEPFQGVFFRE
ncbi:MAG TPA: Ig-like domain-containing protein, partial [Rectinemataceae bacterium]|nr:Ig-like domain-containing protein [Rectinemataceae bacterium]